jgi:hypothetical protein
MRVFSGVLFAAVAITGGLAADRAAAAPDEIQVYTEDMDDPGQFGLELHTNYVLKGATAPSFDGEMRSEHRLQVTPEFSYGLTRTLEAGLYLPVAMSSGGDLYGNGARLRLKYIAPHADGAYIFWGLNGEYGYSASRVSESRTGLELRPIVGYRDARWLVAFNPILDMELSGNASREPNFEPALKVSHATGEGVHAGVEYYGEYGPINHLVPAGERAHYFYGVLDIDIKGFDINLGIGRGVENAADKWVAKAIVAFPFR